MRRTDPSGRKSSLRRSEPPSVKVNGAERPLPVIILSIVDQKSVGFALGATDYLIKPMRKSELLDAVWPETAVVSL